jgi:uncharacterized protein YndB with AHSA1/START domain
MTTQAPSTSVTTSIEVGVPVERAFAAFTEDIGSWWNADHHIIEAKLERMVLEPRVGGNIYDVGVDGSECRWATVLAYDPPHRFAFSWNINLQWKLESDPDRTSEVEVVFSDRGGRTLVELTHRGLDRHGEGWEGMQQAVGSPAGWTDGLQRFAAFMRLASRKPER